MATPPDPSRTPKPTQKPPPNAATTPGQPEPDLARPSKMSGIQRSATPGTRAAKGLGPKPTNPLDHVPLEIRTEEDHFEHGGLTPVRSLPESIEKTRHGKAINTLGPRAASALDNITPELAGDTRNAAPDTGSSPCPSCGWPLTHRSRTCTRCGFIRGGKSEDGHETGAVSTQFRRDEQAVKLERDRRFEGKHYDLMQTPGVRLKAVALCVIAAAINLAIAGAAFGSDTAAAKAVTMLLLLPVSIGIYLMASFVWVEWVRPWWMVPFRVGAAVFGAMVVESVVALAQPVFPFAWIFALALGFLALVGLLSDILDIEMPDAIGLALVMSLARFGVAAWQLYGR